MLKKIKPMMTEAMSAYMGDAVNEREIFFNSAWGIGKNCFLSTNIQTFLFVQGMTNQLTCLYLLMQK